MWVVVVPNVGQEAEADQQVREGWGYYMELNSLEIVTNPLLW